MMLGGYTTVVATNAGVNIWISMLILSPIVVGIIGIASERLLIRFFYGRMVDTLIATWGLSLLLIGLTVLLFIGIYIVFTRTRLGLIARGTMQNAQQASVLGISTPRVYMVTFGIGAALTGLAGGLLAPISQIIPTVGFTYVAQAFITVITGGTGAITGTIVASGVFGTS